MTELIGDTCAPSDLILPETTTAIANTMSGVTILSGLIIYNNDLGKADLWCGDHWETITSVER